MFENIDQDRLDTNQFTNMVVKRMKKRTQFSSLKLFVNMKKFIKEVRKKYKHGGWYREYMMYFKE